METLGEKQERFALYVPLLFTYAHSLGFNIRVGEFFRSDEQAEINAIGYEARSRLATMIEPHFPELAARIRNNGRAGGVRHSTHGLKLAMDLNLFRNGIYLADSESHRPLGAYWKGLASDCRWGGDFSKPDGNHYSIEYQGVR